MVIGFTGTRQGMTDQQRRALKQILEGLVPDVLAHGGAVGADDQADLLASELGVPRVVYPSDMPAERVPYDALQRRGGSSVVIRVPPMPPLERNRHIAFAADLLLAAPHEHREILRSGTWATVRAARRLGRPVVVLEP